MGPLVPEGPVPSPAGRRTRLFGSGMEPRSLIWLNLGAVAPNCGHLVTTVAFYILAMNQNSVSSVNK